MLDSTKLNTAVMRFLLARLLPHLMGLVTTSPNSDPTIQVLMAIKTEKAERVKRQKNVLFSGLPEVQGEAYAVL